MAIRTGDTFTGTSGAYPELGIITSPNKDIPFFFRVGNNKEFGNRAIFLNCWNEQEKSYEMSFKYTFVAPAGVFSSQIKIGDYWVSVYETYNLYYEDYVLTYAVSDSSVLHVQSFIGQTDFFAGGAYDYTITISLGLYMSTILHIEFSKMNVVSGTTYGMFPTLRLNYAADKSLAPPTAALLTFPSNTCPQIRIFASSETMYGENLVPSVFR